MSMDALGKVLSRRPQNTLRIVRIKIASTAPLTIKLPSGATVPGLAVAGLTYAAAGNGVALISEGQIPLVLPTL